MQRKPVFDFVRRLLGRGFKQSEVAGLDAAIDAAMRETGEVLARDFPANDLAVSDRGIALIKEFEGCKLTAYPDPGTGGEPWTIGFGATRINGKPVKPGMRITQDIADKLLIEDVARHADDVRKFLGNAPTTQGQFDAMVSFHFNTGKLPSSTLGKLHKLGNYGSAAAEFDKWVNAGGRKMAGLVRRRDAEQALYLS